jgi:dehydrogenase/reductase SDR family member 7B
MNKKWVWITGASSGIGEAMFKAYADLGHNVIISARTKDKLMELKNKHPNAAKIHVVALDLRTSHSIDLACEEVKKLTPFIDLLINNGGISQRDLAINSSLSTDRAIMEVNFFGTIHLTKNLLPSMIQKKSGHIVVISSLVGKFGTPYRSAYSASKHALHGFFDSLRAELTRDKIDVTIICPGFVNTQISVNALTGDGKKLGEMDHAQANAMSADKFAQKALKAIEQKKLEVYIGGKEILGVYIKRLLPNLFAKMIARARVR